MDDRNVPSLSLSNRVGLVKELYVAGFCGWFAFHSFGSYLSHLTLELIARDTGLNVMQDRYLVRTGSQCPLVPCKERYHLS